MTKVDFYILENGGYQPFLVKLIEKLYRNQHRLHVVVADDSTVTSLDQQLWVHRDISFIPHATKTDNDSITPVIIQTPEHEPTCNDVLVNLAPEIPLFFSQFERVVEIVDKSSANRENARDHYRFYQERGYSIKNHTIN